MPPWAASSGIEQHVTAIADAVAQQGQLPLARGRIGGDVERRQREQLRPIAGRKH